MVMEHIKTVTTTGAPPVRTSNQDISSDKKNKTATEEKRRRRKRNKIFLNEFDAKRSSLISVSALKKTAAQHRKNFQKLGCSPKSMESLPLVP